MNTSQISINSQTQISGQCQDLHKAVILFNHTPSSDEEKPNFKEFIEKPMASVIKTVDSSWELVPVS